MNQETNISDGKKKKKIQKKNISDINNYQNITLLAATTVAPLTLYLISLNV